MKSAPFCLMTLERRPPGRGEFLRRSPGSGFRDPGSGVAVDMAPSSCPAPATDVVLALTLTLTLTLTLALFLNLPSDPVPELVQVPAAPGSRRVSS